MASSSNPLQLFRSRDQHSIFDTQLHPFLSNQWIHTGAHRLVCSGQSLGDAVSAAEHEIVDQSACTMGLSIARRAVLSKLLFSARCRIDAHWLVVFCLCCRKSLTLMTRIVPVSEKQIDPRGIQVCYSPRILPVFQETPTVANVS